MTPPGPIEAIVWRDCYTPHANAWLALDEVKALPAHVEVCTVGAVVREDDEAIVMVGAWSAEDAPDAYNVCVIPTCNVLRRTRLEPAKAKGKRK